MVSETSRYKIDKNNSSFIVVIDVFNETHYIVMDNGTRDEPLINNIYVHEVVDLIFDGLCKTGYVKLNDVKFINGDMKMLFDIKHGKIKEVG